MVKNFLLQLKVKFFARWVACGIVPDKKSVQYGIYFSYPIYILAVAAGTFLQSPYILLVTALIAFLSIKLPLHLLDYLYNFVVVKFVGNKKIPGRGSELQVNSVIALVFNFVVLALIAFSITINYGLLAIIYVLSSIFFIGIFLFKD